MNTRLLAITLFAITGTAIWLYPEVQALGQLPVAPHPQEHPQPIKQAEQAPRIEVVFALDTTGSMGGLIQTAKEKIWSIASTMAAGQPAPEIRMGLVAYRDRGDSYVTRVYDLSGDLDQVYAQLMDFEAAGGGDGPESVNQALNDALQQISWSKDKATYRTIFLVGDAPPHRDYAGEMQFPALASLAQQKGIVINAIRCGSNPDTAQAWQQIASVAGGQFFSVTQGGGALAIATPFDNKLATLSRKLDETRMVYGDKERLEENKQKIAATKKLHEKSSDAALARRATFNSSASGKRNQFGDSDLLSDLAEGRVELGAIDDERLPASVRALPEEDRADYTAKVQAERSKLEQEIQGIAREREAFLAKEAAAAPEAAASLDYQIFETVRDQGKDKGLVYESPKL